MVSKSKDNPLSDIAVIGGGFAGMITALSMKARGLNPTIYELREPGHLRLPGGVVLTANGQSALELVGALDCVKDKGFSFDALYYTDEKDQIVGQTDMDSKHYGYTATRILRSVCLSEWRKLLEERGIPIHYNSRFGGVISDTEYGVSFKINDQVKTASMLIGADGIHSSTRKHVCPDAKLEYQGLLGIMAHISVHQIRFPFKDYPHVSTIMSPHGGFMMIPETPDESVVLAARQVEWPEQDRAGWDQILQNRDKLFDLLGQGYDKSNNILRSFVDAADTNHEKLFIWPFYIAKVNNWASPTGRVVLIGDAAHALPPSSGQGVNQALEDAYTLGRVLGLVGSARELKSELKRWQVYRAARVEKVLEWVAFMESTTAADEWAQAGRPKATKETLSEQAQSFGWVFTPPFGDDFEKWLAG